MQKPQEEKIDRRALRTRRFLREALFSLILEKGYHAVTIEEITERADLARTTFYLHYKDKDDLYLASIESFVEELKAQITDQVIHNKTHSQDEDRFALIPSAAIRAVFYQAQANPRFFRILLEGESQCDSMRHIHNIIQGLMEDHFASQLSKKVTIPMDALSAYFSGALLAFISTWLASDQTIDADHMADLFLRLFCYGIERTLSSEISPNL